MNTEATARGLMRHLIPLGAALPWAGACLAGDAIGAAPGPQGREIMVYFSQPIGASGALRVYGLRLDQASAPIPLPGSTVLGAIRRRELVDLQLGSHANVRIDFARRLSFDFGRRQFNAPGYPSAMVLSPSMRAIAPSAHLPALP